jgi:translation elongation factor P/translation initiation factor 5A
MGGRVGERAGAALHVSGTKKAGSLWRRSAASTSVPATSSNTRSGIWKVAKTQHTQPGKGGAFMQVEMKNLIDGRKTNVRFRSADTVEKVRLDTKDFQYLYAEGEDAGVHGRTETYDQISLPKRPAWRCRRLPAGRHDRARNVRRAPDLGAAARTGRSHRSSRPTPW